MGHRVHHAFRVHDRVARTGRTDASWILFGDASCTRSVLVEFCAAHAAARPRADAVGETNANRDSG